MNDFLQSLRGGQKDKRTPKTRRSFDNTNHYNSSNHYHNQGPYQNVRSGNLKRGTRQAQHPVMPPVEDQTPYMDNDTAESIKTLAEAMAKHQELLAETAERRVLAEERKANALEDIAEALRFIIASSVDGNEEEFADEESFSAMDDIQELEETEKEAPVEFMKADIPEPVVTEERLVPRRPPGRPRIIREPEEVAAPQETVKVLKRTRAQKIEAKKTDGRVRPEARKIVRKVPARKSAPTGGPLSRDEVMDTINSMRSQGATFEEVAQHFISIGQPTFSGRGEWHAQTVHRLCNRRK